MRMSDEERANPELVREKLLSMVETSWAQGVQGAARILVGGRQHQRAVWHSSGVEEESRIDSPYRYPCKSGPISSEGPRITKTNLDALQDALGLM